MINGISFTALVPARAGSKRLTGKNMRLLGDRPLLGWTLAAAEAALSLDEIIVSTDCNDAASLAAAAGVRVLWRDASLAGDNARNIDVVRFLVESGEITTDAVVVLQPTSPLRPAWHIEQCLAACHGDRGSLSVTMLGNGRSVWVRDGAHMRALLGPEAQDVALLRPSGACYVCLTASLQNRAELFATTDATVPLEWPYSIDIDTSNDLELAKALLVAFPQLEARLTEVLPPTTGIFQ